MNNYPTNLQATFNAAATEYDRLRRKLIPCFDDFYRIAVEIIPGAPTAPLKILDLGAGTGLYSAMVQAAFPNAEITLVDFATEMLAQAKSRFQQIGKSPQILVGDYQQIDLGSGYDVVISGLSIHHLSDSEKQLLYQRIYRVLKPEGMFINAEQVSGRTSKLEQEYQKNWTETICKLGVTENELKAAQQRREYDRLATVDAQLQWLEKAGFVDVDCWYKNYSFAVFGGTRPIWETTQPKLATQRLILRSFSLADAPTVQHLLREKEVTVMTAIPHPYEEGMAEKWIQTHRQDFAAEKQATFAITLESSGELCGAIGLIINRRDNNAEMGYWIGKAYWNQGYCTEAGKAMLKYGFETLGLNRIHAAHFARNPGSGRVMEKMGMSQEGYLRQHTLKGDNYEDVVQYGILKSEWEE
ncbi:MAG: GNAT family N-acetyltransferase [Oscillatoria sp. PMC 1068.18]|nr:GNAT family N-acetyltransferase [Oscillatoria sp. PMC 1076.18]MEC4990768.1 GNAT family N-acetyltransferase [Oscillatoria sp. PMC 1068.18]